jgi:hypothetical protein
MKRAASFVSKAAIFFSLSIGVLACAAVDEVTGSDEEAVEDDEALDSHEETSEALTGPGPCAGQAIDRAVRCAQSKGARVLSFYRSPAEQERVRRENGCDNRCTGSAGCVRPTAGCTSSPHTKCKAVDLVNDGAPATRAQLRACGLAKTTAPHRNHYDLIF